MAFDRDACAAFYAENGYYIHENALTLEEVEMLREDATRICRGDAGAVRGLLPTGGEDSDGDILSRYVCIHFPHKLTPLMYETLAHPAMVDVLTSVIGPNVKCMQSMLFIKASILVSRKIRLVQGVLISARPRQLVLSRKKKQKSRQKSKEKARNCRPSAE